MGRGVQVPDTVFGGALCQSFEWSHEIGLGYTLQTDAYYTAEIHALHVIGGMIAITIVAFQARTFKRQLVDYWHFVDVVGSSSSVAVHRSRRE